LEKRRRRPLAAVIPASSEDIRRPPGHSLTPSRETPCEL
jgi:hypothetical protein